MLKNQKWCKATNLAERQDFCLVMTHDIDSLLSCNYLNRKFGIEVGGFFDYKKLMLSNQSLNKNPIYVDCDLTNGLCYGNHFTFINNPNAVNFNNDVIEYHKKYAGSTIMMLISLYEENLDEFTDEQLFFYSIIDGFHQQFFRFRPVWDYWVNEMKMTRLTGILEQYTAKDMLKVVDKYQLKYPVGLSKMGTLYWNGRIKDIYNDFGIDIVVPKGKFNMIDKQFKTVDKHIDDVTNEDMSSMFSNVRTFRDKVQYSIITKDWGNSCAV